MRQSQRHRGGRHDRRVLLSSSAATSAGVRRPGPLRQPPPSANSSQMHMQDAVLKGCPMMPGGASKLCASIHHGGRGVRSELYHRPTPPEPASDEVTVPGILPYQRYTATPPPTRQAWALRLSLFLSFSTITHFYSLVSGPATASSIYLGMRRTSYDTRYRTSSDTGSLVRRSSIRVPSRLGSANRQC